MMRKTILFGLTTVLLFVATIAPIYANDVQPPPVTIASEVELILRDIAEGADISEEQARAYLISKAETAPFLDAIKAEPDLFAASRVNASDGTYTVSTTLSPDEAEARWGSRPNVTFVQVANSQNELDRLNDAAISLLIASDASITSIDYETGEIVIADHSPPTQAEAQALFDSFDVGDYPVRVESIEAEEAQACNTSRSNCTPWRGGIVLTRNGNPHCTSFGWVTRLSNRPILTAAHCGDNATFGHAGDTVGTDARNSLWDATYSCGLLGLDTCSATDSMRLATDAGDAVNANNWFYKSLAQNDYALTGNVSEADLDLDDILCSAGIISAYRCGPILSLGVNVARDRDGDGDTEIVVANEYQIDYASALGDSGGPVHGITSTGVWWAGLHHGGTSSYGVASPVIEVQNDMNVNTCKVSNC